MEKNKAEILKTNKKVGRYFARAYRYIKAAASVYEDIAEIYGRAVDRAAVNIAAAELIKNMFGEIPVASEEGRQWHMFASAITPNGMVNYLDFLLAVDRVYVVQGQPGTGTERLLERVRTAAVERGFYTDSFYCALFPNKLEHIILPELNMAFATFNKYHNTDISEYNVIDLDEFVDGQVLSEDAAVISYNRMQFEELMDEAVSTIAKAKALHDELETYYIPNMDFEAVQRCWEATMARVLAYALVGVG